MRPRLGLLRVIRQPIDHLQLLLGRAHNHLLDPAQPRPHPRPELVGDLKAQGHPLVLRRVVCLERIVRVERHRRRLEQLLVKPAAVVLGLVRWEGGVQELERCCDSEVEGADGVDHGLGEVRHPVRVQDSKVGHGQVRRADNGDHPAEGPGFPRLTTDVHDAIKVFLPVHERLGRDANQRLHHPVAWGLASWWRTLAPSVKDNALSNPGELVFSADLDSRRTSKGVPHDCHIVHEHPVLPVVPVNTLQSDGARSDIPLLT